MKTKCGICGIYDLFFFNSLNQIQGYFVVFVFKNTAHEHISYSVLVSSLFYKTMSQGNIVKNTCQVWPTSLIQSFCIKPVILGCRCTWKFHAVFKKVREPCVKLFLKFMCPYHWRDSVKLEWGSDTYVSFESFPGSSVRIPRWSSGQGSALPLQRVRVQSLVPWSGNLRSQKVVRLGQKKSKLPIILIRLKFGHHCAKSRTHLHFPRLYFFLKCHIPQVYCRIKEILSFIYIPPNLRFYC